MKNSIEIRNVGGDRPWRIFRTGTDELVDDGRYETLEEAGVVANRILEDEPRAAAAGR